MEEAEGVADALEESSMLPGACISSESDGEDRRSK